MNYNYLSAMVEDVKQAIKENPEIDAEQVLYFSDDLKERLYDDLWIDDSVTGNASGSYYCNCYKAKEAVQDNMDLCKEAMTEFCVEPSVIGEKFLNEDWEYLDVTIRCYLLGQAIDKAVDELQDEIESDNE